MCFVNDYDWYAQEVAHSTRPAATPTRCAECRETIPVGGLVHHTFMQEYEECHICYEGDCTCADDKCCQCEEPEYGETFDYDCCDGCHKFLSAVQHAEEDAGCSGDETRPPLGEMRSAIRDGGRDEAKRYWLRALRDYPELKASGYLGRLWKNIFGGRA